MADTAQTFSPPEADAGPVPALGVRRSVTGRAWRLRGGEEADRRGLAMAQQLGLPEIIGRVLAGRGIGIEAADAFLNPSLRNDLPDPATLLDMYKAAARLADAIMGGEPCAVFGDYDVDGATSSALLKRYFNAVGGDLRIYIPDRQKEGYGPNAPALRKLAEEGARILITVDCGTLAHEALAAGAQAGLEIIIVDHHQATEHLPQAALAIVNPNRLDDLSGCGQLAAVGVAFLLVVALNRELRARGHFSDARPEPDLRQWLDLVALGTVADVVPLVGVNRALVRTGLNVLAARGNAGLAALMDVAKLKGAPEAWHLGFLLGPRVNAGGRVGKADLGARLLTTDDMAEAHSLAQLLDTLNRERQAIEGEVVDTALLRAAERGADPVLLVAEAGWHPGVIGIVASRLRERFDRPAFVLAVGDDGLAKGSGRSMPGVDLGRAVTAAREAGLLIDGGGHAMAAGLTVAADGIDRLRAFLCERLADDVAAAQANSGLRLDGVLAVGGATRPLVDTLARLGPFGAGHGEPLFALPAARVTFADRVGTDHVRCTLRGAEGGTLKAIAFRCADGPLGRVLLERVGHTLHLAGRLQPDDWNGRKGVQLRIEDAALA